ncbi:MAG TPA: hypothetical protein VLA33_00935 [Gemmatimonadota bacterium]|nr:hypothetical protein [Gemmatimonadota bacterium]
MTGMPSWGRGIVLAAGSISFALVTAEPVAGQGYRAEVTVGGSYLEVRPLVRDSLPVEEVEGTSLRRRLPDGTVVTCLQGDFCRWFGAGEVESVGVTTQEARVTGWSGIQGLSARVHVRGRYGTDDFWPLSSEKFEAVSAYLDYDRSLFRARAGRLVRRDGLGYYNFDGGAFLWRKWDPLWVEVYGGWALARGLNFPRSGDLLARSDPLAPDDRGFILGAEAGARIGDIASGRVSYQREIRTDRLALYTERLALDARAFLGPAVVEASGEYDFSYEQFNDLRLRVNTPVVSRLEATAEARHYTPFFELWTIWGAFNPVGFNEGRLSLAWSAPSLGLQLRAGGARRSYEETSAGPAESGLRDDGWRILANADWRGGPWFASGGYHSERGFGAARSGGDVRLGRFFDDHTHLSFRGTVTQAFGEFRLNEQIVSGVGVDGAIGLGELSLNAGGAVYWIEAKERPVDGDWTQVRVYGSLSYSFGTDTGGQR